MFVVTGHVLADPRVMPRAEELVLVERHVLVRAAGAGQGHALVEVALAVHHVDHLVAVDVELALGVVHQLPVVAQRARARGEEKILFLHFQIFARLVQTTFPKCNS